MTPRWHRRAVASWAVLAVAATLAEAIVRLGARALRTLETGLSPTGWLVVVVATCALVWIEGHRALQRRFVPRLVAAALELSSRGGWPALLAPLYAVSLVDRDRRRCAAAWRGVAAIAAAVLIVRALPDPWRGIVDTAVAAALAWGLAALLAQYVTAMRDTPPRALAEPVAPTEVALRKAG